MAFFRRNGALLFGSGFACATSLTYFLSGATNHNSNNNNNLFQFGFQNWFSDDRNSSSYISPSRTVAHCFMGKKKPVKEQPEPESQPTFVPYEDMYAICYALMEADEEYQQLGMVRRDEVEKTVLPNAYCQMGIITPAGVRSLLSLIGNLSATDVFLDIGCAHGNVVMQILSETPVKIARGVDILPSRIKWAETAQAMSRIFLPSLYYNNRDVEFITGDIAEVGEQALRNCSVVFAHSWMFSPDLLSILGRQLVDRDSVRVVVTSREIQELNNTSWSKEYVELEADWNEKAPFFIYRRAI